MSDIPDDIKKKLLERRAEWGYDQADLERNGFIVDSTNPLDFVDAEFRDAADYADLATRYRAAYEQGTQGWVQFDEEIKSSGAFQPVDLEAMMASMNFDVGLGNTETNYNAEKVTALINYLISPEFEQDMSDSIQEIHNRYGQMILDMAKSLCPVKTGELQDSLYLVELGDGVAIDSDCPYFPYVEARYHMVQQAYDFYEPMIETEIDDVIGQSLVLE